MPLLLSGAVSATAALALGLAGCNSSEPGSSGEGCVSTPEFFATNVEFTTFATKCVACHNATGEAKDTQFVLHSSAEAGYLDANLELVRGLAQTEKNGESILLQKPLGKLDHGGGQQLDAGSQEYADLKTLVDKLNADDTCPTNSAEFFAGVQMSGADHTLRKASLVLAARLPTDAEIAAVDAKGFDALPAILDGYMNEEAFYDRLRESYNDRFFTDFYMQGNNNPLELISPDPDDPATQYYSPEWYDSIAHDNGSDVTASEADVVKYGATDPGISVTSWSSTRARPSRRSRSSSSRTSSATTSPSARCSRRTTRSLIRLARRRTVLRRCSSRTTPTATSSTRRRSLTALRSRRPASSPCRCG